MWGDRRFWPDASWRALRTFCQTLSGFLVVVQIMPDMHVPWTGYLYASAVAALSSLMQSVGRERVANSVRESTAPEPTPTTGQSDYQNAAPGPGCGGDMR